LVIGPVPGSPASIAFDFDLGGMLTDVSSVVVTVDSCEVDLDVLCNDSLGRAEPVVLVLGPDAFALGAPAFAWPEAVETIVRNLEFSAALETALLDGSVAATLSIDSVSPLANADWVTVTLEVTGVPEPASIALIAAGVAALAIRARIGSLISGR